MNPDTLERLLIDRDAGELPADTLELLSAYLQTRPGEVHEVAEIEDTLRLARQALAPRRKAALPLPAFKPEFRVLEHKNESPPRLASWPLAMAACFAFGLFAGWFWLRSNVPVQVVVEKRLVVAQAPPPPSPQTSSFWSADRLYRAELSAPHSASSDLVWESPVKKPQIKSPL